VVRFIFGFFAGLLLTACAPSAGQLYAPAPVAYSSPTPPLIVRAAYVTANAQATQSAADAQAAQIANDHATQSAALTQTAIPPAQTIAAATAQYVAIVADANARHATETANAETLAHASTATALAFAADVSNSMTQIAATRVISESLIAVVNVEANARRANERAEVWQMFLFALAFIIVLGVAFLIGALANKIDVEHRAKATKTIVEGNANASATLAEGEANASATLARAEAEAWAATMRASVFSVVGGLIQFGDHPPVVVNRPGLTEQAAPQLAAQSAQPPMLNSASGSRPLVAKERQAISDFLWRAVRRSGEYAKTIDTIPSHTTMGMGGPRWTEHVHTLEDMGFAEVVPNKGTFVRGYRTLEELARAVGNGAGIIPSPTTSTTSESDEPFSENGKNGQNGQTTLRSRTEAER
jgi:hypothetical protein